MSLCEFWQLSTFNLALSAYPRLRLNSIFAHCNCRVAKNSLTLKAPRDQLANQPLDVKRLERYFSWNPGWAYTCRKNHNYVPLFKKRARVTSNYRTLIHTHETWLTFLNSHWSVKIFCSRRENPADQLERTAVEHRSSWRVLAHAGGNKAAGGQLKGVGVGTGGVTAV